MSSNNRKIEELIYPMGAFIDDIDNWTTTFSSLIDEHGVDAPTRPPNSAALTLYDIFIPMLGIFIIVFNLLVVISSGLILKKGKFTVPSGFITCQLCHQNQFMYTLCTLFNRSAETLLSFIDLAVCSVTTLL